MYGYHAHIIVSPVSCYHTFSPHLSTQSKSNHAYLSTNALTKHNTSIYSSLPQDSRYRRRRRSIAGFWISAQTTNTLLAQNLRSTNFPPRPSIGSPVGRQTTMDGDEKYEKLPAGGGITSNFQPAKDFKGAVGRWLWYW